MRTNKRCIKEASGSAYNWHCSRRSHPVQRMGGVCAMCLTERLLNISRSAEAGRLKGDQASFGYLRLAASFNESMGSDATALQQCGGHHMGAPEISARHSSAGSEQSIASLIEREIDEGRRRFSDVTAGFSMLRVPGLAEELALPEKQAGAAGFSMLRAPGMAEELALPEKQAGAACKHQAQLARSRSYSTNFHVDPIHSTPASCCKSNSSTLQRSGRDSCQPCSYISDGRTGCTTPSNSCRRFVTAATVERRSYDHALLTRSKSTGSNYPANCKLLRSPINRVWNLPNFWHKKCGNHMQEKRYDLPSDDPCSVIVQADESVPFTTLRGSCSKRVGPPANCINQNRLCLGKWLYRSALSWRRCSSKTQARPNSSACGQESSVNTEEVAASSSSSSSTAATSAADHHDQQLLHAKGGVAVRGLWRFHKTALHVEQAQSIIQWI